tara:strand:- start:3026 stop:3937 length:912 start_codon:yes stop_codon:yes gene_type:complete
MIMSSDKEKDFIECYDIGGTNIRAALISQGKIEEPFLKEKTEKDNVDSFVQQIKNISSLLRKQHSRITSEQIKAVSMAVPGPVEGMKLLGSKPLDFYEEINFENLLGGYFGIPLLLGNDLNMASQGELALGKFKDKKNLCLLTISTGIGVGVIINGAIYDRKTEIGHNIIETNPQLANPCLGHNGCWAAQSSGFGIEKTVEKIGKNINASQVFEEPQFQEVVDKVRKYNAYGIGNLINAYDPEKIIIMGSLGLKQFDRIIPEANLIKQFTLVNSVPEIAPTELGENIGLLGAYYSAIKIIKSE